MFFEFLSDPDPGVLDHKPVVCSPNLTTRAEERGIQLVLREAGLQHSRLIGDSMHLKPSLCRSGSSCLCSMMASIPRMPLMGVRRSWDI